MNFGVLFSYFNTMPHCCPLPQKNSLPIKAVVVCSRFSCLIEKWVSRQKSAVLQVLQMFANCLCYAMHNCFANFYESVWHFAQSFKLSGSKKKKRYRRLWSQSNQNIRMRGLQSKEESKFNIWFIHKQCIILPKQLFLVQFLKSKRESLRSWNSMFIPSWSGKFVNR